MLQQYAIVAADLNKPLGQAQTKQRRGLAVPILAASLSALLCGSAIFWAVVSDNPLRGERGPHIPAEGRAIVPAPQIAQAEVPPTAAAAAAMPTAKTVTVTVIDSQTGAKREVVVPAPTSAQSEDNQSQDNSVLPSTTPVTPQGHGRNQIRRSNSHPRR